MPIALEGSGESPDRVPTSPLIVTIISVPIAVFIKVQVIHELVAGAGTGRAAHAGRRVGISVGEGEAVGGG